MLKPSPGKPTIKQCLDDPKFLSRFTKGLVIPVNEREILKMRILSAQETMQTHPIWDESAGGYVEPRIVPAKKYKGYGKK